MANGSLIIRKKLDIANEKYATEAQNKVLVELALVFLRIWFDFPAFLKDNHGNIGARDLLCEL